MDFSCRYCRAIIYGPKETCDKHEQTCDKNPEALASTILAALSEMRARGSREKTNTTVTPTLFSSSSSSAAGPLPPLPKLPPASSLTTSISRLYPFPSARQTSFPSSITTAPRRPLPPIPETTGTFPSIINTSFSNILRPPPGLPPRPNPNYQILPPPGLPQLQQNPNYELLPPNHLSSRQKGIPCLYAHRGCEYTYLEPPEPKYGPPVHGPLLEHETYCVYKPYPVGTKMSLDRTEVFTGLECGFSERGWFVGLGRWRVGEEVGKEVGKEEDKAGMDNIGREGLGVGVSDKVKARMEALGVTAEEKKVAAAEGK
ncbi:hypothetical protein QBC38DRAFT_521650 [Podospora fimiseda]|uniref:Uncharacterized protein n=1 Tax=Podospora fimiseda TaxID=252190 RepID=A0AAN6YRU5_9PEZI|nr:hypothetical protein QBC38DRAFT_521650 [Podospora fimiseda]